MSRIGQSIAIESRLVVSRSWGGWEMGVTAKGAFLLGWKIFFNGLLHSSVNILKPTEAHILKGWTIKYMNYISKLSEKKASTLLISFKIKMNNSPIPSPILQKGIIAGQVSQSFHYGNLDSHYPLETALLESSLPFL